MRTPGVGLTLNKKIYDYRFLIFEVSLKMSTRAKQAQISNHKSIINQSGGRLPIFMGIADHAPGPMLSPEPAF
jgi:hypothetical protein